MSECPWYVTAAAAREYQALRPRAARDFDAARDDLIGLCADVWKRYETTPELAPRVGRTGLYLYRGPTPLRIEIAVSMERRSEGPKGQVVAVLSVEREDEAARAHQNQRKRQSPSALKRKAARAAMIGTGPEGPKREDDGD